jgi:hypothetical protein
MSLVNSGTVGIMLERDNGMVVGIEVKASAMVKAGDFSGLRALAEACGDRFEPASSFTIALT